jgi:hypothetical protein
MLNVLSECAALNTLCSLRTFSYSSDLHNRMQKSRSMAGNMCNRKIGFKISARNSMLHVSSVSTDNDAPIIIPQDTISMRRIQ